MAETRIAFILSQVLRKLWVQAAAFGILGVAIVPLARFLGPVLPAGLEELTGAGAVEGILDILASSMLAVTTFSLSIMVSAYAGATASVTPRAVKLLLQDRTSQTVLSTFIGAFLYSIVGIISIEAGAFSDAGIVVLFLTTIVVIGFVVVALIRWISHLTTFGRVEDTTERVERAVTSALRDRAVRPALGGIPVDNPAPPRGCRAIKATRTGYLCHIDMPRLSEVAGGLGAERDGPAVQPILHLACLPGAFLHPAAPLLWAPVDVPLSADELLREAFTINPERTFEQDPRFGLCVLTEIAERALSPAVNDPGTAIDVLGRTVRVLSTWIEEDPEVPIHPQIAVPALDLADLFEDVFPPIARDGAGKFSVQMRLQKTLVALARLSPPDFGPQALVQSERALKAARAAGLPPEDLERLEVQVARVRAAVGAPQRPPRRL